MTFSLSDGLLLAVLGLSALAYVAPTLTAALEARKATRLARVVAAGGRLAATIAVELRGVPPGATAAEVKARLVAEAVQRLKSPELMGETIAKLGGSDAGVKNIVEGELAKLQLVVLPASAAADAVSAPATPTSAAPVATFAPDLVLPLTPAVPPTPYPPGGLTVAGTSGGLTRAAPILFALALIAGCALPQSRTRAAFEAEAAYVVAARGSAAYVLTPGAEPVTAATLRRLERGAYEAVVASRADPGDAAKLAVAQRQVEALTRFMAERGLR